MNAKRPSNERRQVPRLQVATQQNTNHFSTLILVHAIQIIAYHWH